MADEAQLKILKEGVEAWNRWRSQNREVQVDLLKADLYRANLHLVNFCGANLREANLRESDLRGADLSKANLTKTYLYEASLSKVHLYETNLHRANLRGADLREANLRKSDLHKANLSKANLYGANLRGADLGGTDLRGANLRGADLRGTDLRGADINGVSMDKTSLGDIDLSAVQGLDTVKHFGPSTVGIDTIYLSKGKIPAVFLRGAGVPDEFITYMKSLGTTSIEYYSCFISYSSKDEEFAQRLYKDLQGKGVRCWFAPHDMQSGRKLHEQIDQAIRIHERVLLILSPDSMNSEWVKTEIVTARKREFEQKKQVLFPLRLVSFELIRDWECFDADTGKDSAREIREYFIPDFSNWKNDDEYQKAFGRLMKDLTAGSQTRKRPT